MGLLGYYIASFCDLEGLKYIDANLERVIIFIYPTLVVIFSFFFLSKKVSRIHVLAIIFSYLGIAITLGGNIQVNASGENL